MASIEPKSERRVLDLKFSPSSLEVAFTADSEMVELLPFQSPDAVKSKKALKVRQFVAHDPRVKGLDFGLISIAKGSTKQILMNGQNWLSILLFQ